MIQTSTTSDTPSPALPPAERRADGFLHRRVDVGEVRLHLAEARPQGISDTAEIPSDVPLVVFLHGFPECWWSWRRQLTGMANAGFWAVAPDMRGYNESDKPRGVPAYGIDALVGDVAGLLRALGRERATVVGHDWGGVVAWAFAERRPEMVERLAILNVPHPLAMKRGLLRPKQLRKSWYMFFFQLPLIPERVMARRDYAALRRMFRDDGVPAEDVERLIDGMRVPGSTTAAINYYRAAIRSVLAGRAPTPRPIACPVLVIWGDRDRFLGSEMAQPPAHLVPNARVVHLPDASHWVQTDAPERVNDLLVELARGAS